MPNQSITSTIITSINNVNENLPSKLIPYSYGISAFTCVNFQEINFEIISHN